MKFSLLIELAIMESGIYEIVNTVNGRRYIGSTNNFLTRYAKHLSHLRGNDHDNPKLQAAWNKYGENAFDFRPLERCEECDLLVVEQRWLDLIFTNGERHYNVARYACSGAKGRSPSAETRAKQAASVKATYDEAKRAEHSAIQKACWTPERRAAHAAQRKAAWAAKSEEEKARIKEARRIGREKPEAKAKQLAGTRKLFEDPAFRAKQAAASAEAARRPETRAKHSANLSARNKKMWADPAYAERMSAVLRAEANSEEGRYRRSAQIEERWKDPEHAEKLRAAIKAGRQR